MFPSHDPGYEKWTKDNHPGGSNIENRDPRNLSSGSTGIGYTNITISNTGGSQKFDVRQPVVYGYYIVRFE